MTEPSKYKEAALGWLLKFRANVKDLEKRYRTELHKLVQRMSIQLALRERIAKFSEWTNHHLIAFKNRFASVKDQVVTRAMPVYRQSMGAMAKVQSWYRKNKRILVSGVAALTLFAVVFAVTYKPIYAVTVDGEVIGYVHDVELLQESLDEVILNYEDQFQQEVAPGQSVEFVRIRGEKVEVKEVEEVKEALLDCISFETPGYMIAIDGEPIFGVSSIEDAEMILSTVKEQYIAKIAQRNTVVEAVEIEEDVSYEEMDIPLYSLMEPEEAVNYLMTGGVEIKVYKVVKGDSLWSISKEHSTSLADLRDANPDLKGDTLSVGQEINLQVAYPYLNIISREIVTETVRIAFREEVQRDSSMWTWERRVAQRGQSGQKQVVYEVVRRNGAVVEKEVQSESVIQEPVVQIVVRGSRQDTSALVVGTGRFLWPVQGRITSPYGSRSGGFHTGVDIAAARNTPIRAADDGTVTVAVYSNRGYGNRVEINHGNGYSTLYAHCNSLAVRQGQVVKKGQIIAYVGSTGRSSGDHLHFEIRVNGSHVNPMRYF